MLDENGNESFESLGCGKYIHDGYTIFGRHVNRYRHIPSVVDGLKPVYKHVLQACYERPDKFTKTIDIVGNCLSKYHFTGDASVVPVVSELAKSGMLDKQGNHGYYRLRGGDDSHAAPRYTEAKLNSTVRYQLDKLYPYVPHTTSITGYEEYAYFPTPIPLSLVLGSLGIGLGIGCRIPAFTIESLYNAYLNDDYHLLKFNYGYELDEESEEGLKSLWETGRGSLVVKIPIEEKWIYDNHGYECSCNPKLFKPLLTKLEEWESYGWVSIEDTSDEVSRLFVHRTKRTRSITDEQVYEELKIACRKRIGYSCVVFDGNITGVIGIRDWIDVAFKNYQKLYENYRLDHLKSLDFEWVMWRDFHRVAELILEQNEDASPKHTYEEIVDIVNNENLYRKGQAFRDSYKPLTLDHVNAIGRKSINTLRTADGQDKIAKVEESIQYFNNLDIDAEIKDYVYSWVA